MSEFESVHERLRSATRAAHHALDHHPLLQRLVKSDLTREAYAQSLQAIYAAHAELEARVLESQWHRRSPLELHARSELLRRDLDELGRRPIEPSVERFARAQSESEWLGQVYVLEGSRLGSVVIVGRVVGSLGEGAPRRFLAAVHDADAWPRILSCIEQRLDTPARVHSAFRAARAAFAAYESALDAPPGA
ncbi:MAG: biliverdin-producing heme oxygenase [Xanthomonadales bacterium]|nr:biliverdin-producing heme oxygenase [Xanthomonadales bacterium]